ncbi:MAG: CCDC90 family protein [Desulfovibrio sp.]|jgi:hypothetical protein|nr:CCDC90 family protein [Desulfovibrio sp.]
MSTATVNTAPIIAPVLFDTLRYAKRLQEIGFPREQAEGFAELQREIVDERLATKADIRRLEAEIEVKFKELDAKIDLRTKELDAKIDLTAKELNAKIDTVAKELDAKIEFTAKNLEYKLTVRLGSMMAASIVIVAALVKLL